MLWESIDKDTARFTMTFNGITQAADIKIDTKGNPAQVIFQR